ncbi:MAG: response regulator [Candidatus Omnitrophica bacterium]|nr:response regulator [Candidatus Omnitrophota bacterium]
MPKLLVVDDEPDILMMFEDHFGLRGYEVHTAADGLQGVELCRSVRPDVIITDLKMKSMDGDTAVRHMREILPGAKIFIITAYQSEDSPIQSVQPYIDGLFDKSVSILDIQAAVAQALKKQN